MEKTSFWLLALEETKTGLLLAFIAFTLALTVEGTGISFTPSFFILAKQAMKALRGRGSESSQG